MAVRGRSATDGSATTLKSIRSTSRLTSAPSPSSTNPAKNPGSQAQVTGASAPGTHKTQVADTSSTSTSTNLPAPSTPSTSTTPAPEHGNTPPAHSPPATKSRKPPPGTSSSAPPNKAKKPQKEHATATSTP